MAGEHKGTSLGEGGAVRQRPVGAISLRMLGGGEEKVALFSPTVRRQQALREERTHLALPQPTAGASVYTRRAPPQTGHTSLTWA